MRGLGRVVGGALVAAIALIGSPGPAAAITPRDRVATRAFLLAGLREYRALLANVPAFSAAYQGAANQLGGECAGVLKGAPGESREEFTPDPEREHEKSARQRGEESRENAQLEDLTSESSSLLSSAARQADRAPLLAFAAEVSKLSWSDGAVTELIGQDAEEIEAAFVKPVPAVCGDMKLWVASGYRTLSPASKAIVEERESDRHGLLSRLAGSRVLAATEQSAEKPLVGRIERAQQLLSDARQPTLTTASERMRKALGLQSDEIQAQAILTHSDGGRHGGAIKLVHGRTAAGSGYTLWLLHGSGGGPVEECKLNLELEQPHGSSTECASSSGSDPQAKVGCEEGRLTVQAHTLPATRIVRLRLSDGRQIVSRPARVPRRFGHVAGFYYQAVRGPKPIPVQLVELGAKGQRLRVVKLERFIGCTRHPFKYVRGGLLTLAREPAARTPGFAIVAERYRLYGFAHFKLTLSKAGDIGERSAEDEYGGEVFEGGPLPGTSEPKPSHEPLDMELSAGCHPYENAIAYGVLHDRSDTVTALVNGVSIPLKQVPIPPRFQAGGVLVYAALSSVPERIVVTAAGGSVTQSRDMRDAGEEVRETCEGESEGEGPTVGRDGSGITIGVGGFD